MHSANNDENLHLLQFDVGSGPETRKPLELALPAFLINFEDYALSCIIIRYHIAMFTMFSMCDKAYLQN